MSFKPSQATWFETYTPRKLTVHAIEALAESGCVELYHNGWSTDTRNTHVVHKLVHDYRQLANRFECDLPKHLLPPGTHADAPEHLAKLEIGHLRHWAAGLLRLKRRIRDINNKIGELEHLQELLEAIPDHDLDFSGFEHHSEVLCKRVFACPIGSFDHPSGKESFLDVFTGRDHEFILSFATPEHEATVEAAATLVNCHELKLPAWLCDSPVRNLDEINQRLVARQKQLEEVENQLASCRDDAAIKKSLASIRLLEWFIENACQPCGGKRQCHLIGWTSFKDPQQLEAILQRAGIHSQVSFSEQAPLAEAPVSTPHSWWVQPFSLFVNLAGTPGSREIDPTPLLAIIVPLLFGYMFPDVGHGLVLLAAGIVVRRRIPSAALLIPCGIAAIGFGVLFGDVFGRHDILDPLWLKPLENPLEVITIPLIAGGVLITMGLLLSGIEAYWHQRLRIWLLTEAAVMVMYLALIAALFYPQGLWLAAAALAWYLIGTLIACNEIPGSCLLPRIGHLLESLFRLLMNSISFVRVGAFALAHSGTSHAVTIISEMIDDRIMFIIFLVLGHVFIIVLEGLIVFVQTSRLVLFEFFIRFLKAEGRVFKPMHRLEATD